jgi:predicted GTPase
MSRNVFGVRDTDLIAETNMEELPTNLASLVVMLEDFLEKNCPPILRPLLPQLEASMRELKAVVMEAREPRLAIVGRRGAGKSSLINAIFGEERCAKGPIKAQTAGAGWLEYRDKRGGLKILDTRGLGEGHKPAELATDDSALKEIKKAVDQECPDAILFLVKAKEVDARIDPDLKDLIDLAGYIKKAKDYDAPIVGIVTQVDEVDPKQEPAPFNSQRKRQNIETAKELLAGKMKEVLKQDANVFALSAYMDFENGQIVFDGRASAYQTH